MSFYTVWHLTRTGKERETYLITHRTTNFNYLSLFKFSECIATLQPHASSWGVFWGHPYCMSASGMYTLSGAQLGTLGALAKTQTLDTGCETVGHSSLTTYHTCHTHHWNAESIKVSRESHLFNTVCVLMNYITLVITSHAHVIFHLKVSSNSYDSCDHSWPHVSNRYQYESCQRLKPHLKKKLREEVLQIFSSSICCHLF